MRMNRKIDVHEFGKTHACEEGNIDIHDDGGHQWIR